jgi:hypothetical protein
MHLPLHFHFIGDLDFSKPATLSQQIKARRFNYILVDMFDQDIQVNHANPYIIHVDQFRRFWKDGLPKGLVSRGCFDFSRPICLIEEDPE